MFTILLVIIILVVLIVAHELGHFIAAKLFGVRVDEFGVGYPPRAFLFGKLGDTEYTLNWIPFGGFVRLYGEDSADAHGRGSFADAPRWKQAVILLAGVFANMVVAWILFAGAFVMGVPRAVDNPVTGQAVHLLISDVVPGSPAAVGGMSSGDEVLAMQDGKGVVLKGLTPDAVMSYVATRGGQPITITYLHTGATTTATVRPANAVIPDQAGRPALGVGLVLVTYVGEGWGPALIDALTSTKNALSAVCSSLWTILVGAAHGAPNLTGVVGPIGLVGVVGDAAHNGLGNVLALAAFIAVNLTIINLIPIPALDGGRLVVVIIEAMIRRPVPKLLTQILSALGIALIILLMITVTYHDIAHLLA